MTRWAQQHVPAPLFACCFSDFKRRRESDGKPLDQEVPFVILQGRPWQHEQVAVREDEKLAARLEHVQDRVDQDAMKATEERILVEELEPDSQQSLSRLLLLNSVLLLQQAITPHEDVRPGRDAGADALELVSHVSIHVRHRLQPTSNSTAGLPGPLEQLLPLRMALDSLPWLSQVGRKFIGDAARRLEVEHQSCQLLSLLPFLLLLLPSSCPPSRTCHHEQLDQTLNVVRDHGLVPTCENFSGVDHLSTDDLSLC
eukprot:489317-Hanusia_phi.AAC.1